MPISHHGINPLKATKSQRQKQKDAGFKFLFWIFEEHKLAMAKSSNIVHQYFKKEFEGAKILVKVNPLVFTGTEITVQSSGEIEFRDLEFDEEIFEDLAADDFLEVNALEFNLYLSGLIK